MPETLTLGYKASGEQFAAGQLLEFGIQAEQNGFDSVFISDHFQPWRHDGGHAVAAIPWIGALAASTERVIIGTSVLTPTFRYHPLVIAQAFGTLASMFPDRIVLGVGTGESLNESPLGIEWPPIKERFARLKEAVQLMQTAWRSDRVTFDGTYYQAVDATIYDRPEHPVPLYIGAAGPAATRLAGRIADGWITTSGKDDALYTNRLIPAFEEGLSKSQRDSTEVTRLLEVKVSFDHSLQNAKEQTREWAALALTPEEKMGIEDPREMQQLADRLPLDRAASRWIVSDDPDEHVARIRHYVDMGFNHLVFHAPGRDQESFLRLYGQEILPRLRTLQNVS